MTPLAQTARPLLERLRKVVESGSRPFFVALDGRSGAGKSTLAHYVAREMGRAPNGHPFVTVIEGDQFYAGGSDIIWDGRSVEEKVSRGIDWRRQRAVLAALRQTGQASWRPFDWESDDWDADEVPFSEEIIQATATPIVLLEGAYSARPELADLLDLRVLLTVSLPVRRARLLAREGEAYRDDWEQRWSAAEDCYFGRIVPQHEFDLTLE